MILKKLRVQAPTILDLLAQVEREKDELRSSGKVTIINWTGKCKFGPTSLGEMGSEVEWWSTEIHYRESSKDHVSYYWRASLFEGCESCDNLMDSTTGIVYNGPRRTAFSQVNRRVIMSCLDCTYRAKICLECAENNMASCYYCTGQMVRTCHLCDASLVGLDESSDDVDMECGGCGMEWVICRRCSSGRPEGSRVGAVVGRCLYLCD